MKRLFLILALWFDFTLVMAQTPQAIWTEDNSTLTFYYGVLYQPGDDFKGHKVTRVWSGDRFNDIENRHRRSLSDEYYWLVPGWVAEDVYVDDDGNQVTEYCDVSTKIVTAIFDDSFRNYKIKHTQWLFEHCSNMTSVQKMENLCTDIVTDMRGMFYECESLSEIDLRYLNTSNVENLSYAFAGCKSLKKIDLSHLNTSNVTDMRGLFFECETLTEIDVTPLNTKNVKDMAGMFASCSSLKTLYLADLNVRSVNDFTSMFEDCSALEKIYCDKDWKSIRPSADYEFLFTNCDNLVGFVPYDESETGISMANPKKYFTWDCIMIEKKSFDQGVKWADSPINPMETHMDIKQSGNFSYYIDGKNVTSAIAEPGKYNVKIRFQSNDGEIDYSQDFQITVIELPYIKADFDETVRSYCGGEEVEIKFSNIRNVKPDKYSIYFSAPVFMEENDATFDGEKIVFSIPSNLQQGDYQAFFTLKNSEVQSDEMVLKFNIGNRSLKTKWDDVVYIPNPQNLYVKYQWFRDDEEIFGAKKQFYNELDGLNGTYYAIVTDTDGNEFKTCSLEVTKQIVNSAPRVNVFPNPAVAGEQITLQLENIDISNGVELLIFTSSGSFIKRIENAQHTNYLTLSKGGYMGYAVYDGEKIAFKIMVE
ncbi:MAG: BspA family leucine-rich repeat surface protein [Bacteroidales bacterium]|nr:BspA family leucine-rich repeat surface protein [Bacteroidales bacterium]